MKVTIVYDNEVKKEGLRAGWGFSAFIQAKQAPPLLFDTGADSPTLFHNMKELGIDVKRIGIIVISHTHGDHTGGLSGILELNKDAKVYFPASFTKPVQICDNIFSTGELKGIEQSLAVKTDKGILIVTGCSHPGVEYIINTASRFGKVYGIIGGFHGFHNFKRLNDLSLICPCHCTQYKSEIIQLFPQQCLECGAGLIVEI